MSFFGCESKYTNVSLDQNISIDENVTLVSNLEERYLQYWEAFSKGEYEKSYAYELPYLNYLKSLQWYKEFHRTRRTDYKVKLLSIDIADNDSNIAYLKSEFISPRNTITLLDKWIKVENSWYHYYKQTILPEPPKPILQY